MEPRATVSCHCLSCPNCCKLVRVPLTHADLLRLALATDRPIDDFAQWLSPDEIDMTGEPESFVALDVGRRLLVLRHERGACHLLNSEGRCSEYAARPTACAAYPYALTDTTLQDDHRRLYILPDAPCGDAVVGEHPTAREAVLNVERELAEYLAVVKQWNRQQNRRRLAGRRPRDFRTFLGFLAVGSVR